MIFHVRDSTLINRRGKLHAVIACLFVNFDVALSFFNVVSQTLKIKCELEHRILNFAS